MNIRESLESVTTEAAVVAVLASESEAVLHELADGVVLIRDRDGDVTPHDPVGLRAHPRRPNTTQILHTEQSFARYVEAHAVTDETHVYCDIEDLQAVAVFNDHEKGQDAPVAGWRDYRALLQFERGPAWDRWVPCDRNWLTQAEFIDLLEDGIDDVLEPAAADLLELARNFSMNKSVNFRSAVALDTGQIQLEYIEEVSGAGARSKNLGVPEKIKLGLDPIKGDDPYIVWCRLRWRVTDDAKLKVMLVFDRTDEVKEEAWKAVVGRITAALDQLPVLEGRP